MAQQTLKLRPVPSAAGGFLPEQITLRCVRHQRTRPNRVRPWAAPGPITIPEWCAGRRRSGDRNVRGKSPGNLRQFNRGFQHQDIDLRPGGYGGSKTLTGVVLDELLTEDSSRSSHPLRFPDDGGGIAAFLGRAGVMNGETRPARQAPGQSRDRFRGGLRSPGRCGQPGGTRRRDRASDGLWRAFSCVMTRQSLRNSVQPRSGRSRGNGSCRRHTA